MEVIKNKLEEIKQKALQFPCDTIEHNKLMVELHCLWAEYYDNKIGNIENRDAFYQRKFKYHSRMTDIFQNKISQKKVSGCQGCPGCDQIDCPEWKNHNVVELIDDENKSLS